MSQYNPFFIPNGDKNCRLVELPEGLKVVYVLSCEKDYPQKTFTSKGKNYVERSYSIRYTNNMSDHIMRAYMQLKNSTMLELAVWKQQQLTLKIKQLQYNLNSL
jgi:hypothetical protein